MPRIKAPLVYLSLFFALTGCGGGGGGDGQPKTAVDGRNEKMLNLAADHAMYGISISEGAVSLSLFPIKALLNYQLSHLGNDTAIPALCNEGSVLPVLQDNDSNGVISTGDAITLEANSCFNNLIEATAVGSTAIDIRRLEVNTEGTVFLEVTIDYGNNYQLINDDDTIVYVDGRVSAEYAFNDIDETLSITSVSGNPLSLTVEGYREAFREFAITKIAPVASYSTDVVNMTIDINVNSGVLAGDVICGSDDLVFQRPQNKTISSGSFACSGSFGDAELRGASDIFISLPNENDFIRTFTYTATDVLDGTISASALYRAGSFQYEVASKILAVTTNDIVYDSANSRAILSIAASSATTPSSIASYSADNGLETLLEPGVEPLLIAVAADGDTLYTQTDASTIQRFSLSRGISEAEISVTHTVEAFAVSPVDPGLVAVHVSEDVYSSVGELLIYKDGVLFDRYAYNNFYKGSVTLTFSEDGSQLFGSFRSFVIFDIAANTLTLNKSFSNGYVAGTVEQFGSNFYVGSSRLTGDNWIKNGIFTSHGNNRVIDHEKGLAFISSQTLKVCDTETFACFLELETRDYDINYVGARMLTIDGEFLVDFSDGFLHIYNTSDFEKPESESCEAELDSNSAVDIYKFPCEIDDVVYDSIRDKLYALSDGYHRDTDTQTQSRILVIDPVTNEVTTVKIPMLPNEIALSADGSTLFLYQRNTGIIMRYQVSDWVRLSDLEIPLNTDTYGGKVFYKLGDTPEKLVPSATDSEILLFAPQRYRANTIGFNGLAPISAIGINRIPEIIADLSGEFYGINYDSILDLSVTADERSIVSEYDMTTSGLLGSIGNNLALSHRGETVDLTDGAVSTPIDFSVLNGGSSIEGLALDLNNNLVYASYEQYPDYYYAAYDLTTKALVKSGVITSPSPVYNTILELKTNSGVLVNLDDNYGHLILYNESFME